MWQMLFLVSILLMHEDIILWKYYFQQTLMKKFSLNVLLVWVQTFIKCWKRNT